MNDYSDLLFLVGAIAIYALLTTNTNQAMLQNTQMLTYSEMEYGAVSVAQNTVEKARWMDYNDATKAKLEAVNDNSMYKVDVSVSDTVISESDRNNKKINIKVSSAYMHSGDGAVTMSYIKTDR